MSFDTSSFHALHAVFGGAHAPVTPTWSSGRVHRISDKAPSPKPVKLVVLQPVFEPVSLPPVEPELQVSLAPPVPRVKRPRLPRSPKVKRPSFAELISQMMIDPAYIAYANASVTTSQKETPAHVCSMSSVMTTNKRSISDGTYCRT